MKQPIFESMVIHGANKLTFLNYIINYIFIFIFYGEMVRYDKGRGGYLLGILIHYIYIFFSKKRMIFTDDQKNFEI